MARRMIPDINTQALWRLDELGAVSAVDITGNGRTGTALNGCAGVDVSGDGMPWDNARQFVDASSQYVQVPYAAALNPTAAISVGCWAKWSSFIQYQGLISCISTGTFGYLLYVSNISPKTLSFLLRTATTGAVGPSFDADAILNTSDWFHVAGTYDGAYARLYLNGDEVASLPGTGAVTYAGSYPVDFGFYRNNGGAAVTDYFDGYMADPFIKSAAMTPWEIKELWAAVSDPAAGLRP